MDFPNHFCASLFYSIQKAEVKLRVSKQSLQIEKALYEERKIGVIDLDMFSRLQLSETWEENYREVFTQFLIKLCEGALVNNHSSESYFSKPRWTRGSDFLQKKHYELDVQTKNHSYHLQTLQNQNSILLVFFGALACHFSFRYRSSNMFFLLEKGENLKALQLAIRHWLLQGQKKRQMQRLPCEAKNTDLRCLSNSSLPWCKGLETAQPTCFFHPTRGRFSKAHEKKVADQWDQPFGDKASITSSYMIL